MLKLLPLVCPARTAVMRASIGVMSLAAADAAGLKQPARGQGLRSAAS
jgi:hypothetical protein